DLLGRDLWVVPCQADSGQVGHVLTYSVGVLVSELTFNVSQFLPHVVALVHLPAPLRPAGPVATMPAQPVKMNDCLIGAVLGFAAPSRPLACGNRCSRPVIEVSHSRSGLDDA